MALEKLPGWILALTLLLLVCVFIYSMCFLKQPRQFFGYNFGPPNSSEPTKTEIESMIEEKLSKLPQTGNELKLTVDHTTLSQQSEDLGVHKACFLTGYRPHSTDGKFSCEMDVNSSRVWQLKASHAECRVACID